MTDIVERLRSEARRFNRMHEAEERPWLADAAFVADELEIGAAEIERLRQLVEASTLLTNEPGAMTVNCVRGTVRCTERERIEQDNGRLRATLREMRRRQTDVVSEIIACHQALGLNWVEFLLPWPAEPLEVTRAALEGGK